MDNREKVREWVINKSKIKRIKGFNPRAITKDLQIPIEEVYEYCGELVTKDKLLTFRYRFECDCEFSETYNSIASIPNTCKWCDKEIDSMNDTTLEFGFIR